MTNGISDFDSIDSNTYEEAALSPKEESSAQNPPKLRELLMRGLLDAQTVEYALGPNDPYIIEMKYKALQAEEFCREYGNPSGIATLESELANIKSSIESWRNTNPELSQLLDVWLKERDAMFNPYFYKQGEYEQFKETRVEMCDELMLTDDHLNIIFVTDASKRENVIYWLEESGIQYDDVNLFCIVTLANGYYLVTSISGAEGRINAAINCYERLKKEGKI